MIRRAFAAGWPVAPLPRRGTDASGSWSAIWSGDRAPDTAHVTTKLLSSGKLRQVPPQPLSLLLSRGECAAGRTQNRDACRPKLSAQVTCWVHLWRR